MKRSVKTGIGIGFGLWFTFCVLIGGGLIGVAVWAVITLVNHSTK